MFLFINRLQFVVIIYFVVVVNIFLSTSWNDKPGMYYVDAWIPKIPILGTSTTTITSLPTNVVSQSNYNSVVSTVSTRLIRSSNDDSNGGGDDDNRFSTYDKESILSGGDKLNNNNNNNNNKPTIVVVGGTGRIGQIIIQKLLIDYADMYNVRTIVRNITKAQELFNNYTQSNQLTFYQADMSLSHINNVSQVLENCIGTSDVIISTMGIIRFSKLFDFVPWKIFRLHSINKWISSNTTNTEVNHPYFGNYIGHVKLLELAKKYQLKCFIRITGLGIAFPVFNPFVILFNTLLSCIMRWNLLFENKLREQQIVPYFILRPGGLSDTKRNVTTTNIQIDSSGMLPFPGRIGRSDVADICIEAMISSLVPTSTSSSTTLLETSNATGYTLACRWVGTDIKPKPQGIMEDGYSTAKECIANLLSSPNLPNRLLLPVPMKPYGVVVGIAFYTVAAVFIKLSWSFFSLIKRSIFQFIKVTAT